jgi:hypothetical protein
MQKSSFSDCSAKLDMCKIRHALSDKFVVLQPRSSQLGWSREASPGQHWKCGLEASAHPLQFWQFGSRVGLLAHHL